MSRAELSDDAIDRALVWVLFALGGGAIAVCGATAVYIVAAALRVVQG